MHLVLQRCTGGTLCDAPGGAALGEAAAAASLRAVLRSLAACHAAGVVFRDVKPENLLRLDAQPGSPLLLSDFGLAAFWRPGDPPLRERCGTLAYMAPEVVQQAYGSAADVWSAGVLAFFLLTGALPFADAEAAAEGRPPTPRGVWAAVLFGRLDLSPLAPAARDFVGRLLQRDPTRRPSAAQALEHGWVREGGLASAGPPDAAVAARLARFAALHRFQRAALRGAAREAGPVSAAEWGALVDAELDAAGLAQAVCADVYGAAEDAGARAGCGGELLAALTAAGVDPSAHAPLGRWHSLLAGCGAAEALLELQLDE